MGKKCNLNDIFRAKKGHFAPEKRALGKTWGDLAPPVPTPLDVRSKQILLKLGWKTLDERRQNLMEKCMSNVMNDNGPEIIGSLFEKCNNFNYNLRSNGKFLRLSKPNTNSMKRSFCYMGAKTWNQLLNDKL